MKVSDLLIAIAIFSGIGIFLYGTVATEWFGSQGYGDTVPENFIQSEKLYDDSNDLAVLIRDSSPGGDDSNIDPEDVDTTRYGSPGIGVDQATLLARTPALFSEMLLSIQKKTHIPPIFLGIIAVLLLIVVSSKIIGLFTNRES